MANNNSLGGVFLASDGKLREVKSIVIGNTVFNKQIDDNTPQNFLEKILKDNEKYLINETPKYNSINGTGLYKHNGSDYSGGDQPIYFYRGDVNNNWVVFGKDGSNYIWWRIIRNNSNGSIRMIYAGLSDSKTTAPATTGSGTQIGTKAFNTSYNNNMYVGFKYTSGQVHGTGTASTILGAENSTDATTLYGWYNTKLKTNYASYIDMDAGF